MTSQSLLPRDWAGPPPSSLPVLRTTGRISLTCAPGHAWFAHAARDVGPLAPRRPQAFREAERQLASLPLRAGRRPTRIPECDIVAIGPRRALPAPKRPLLLDAPTASGSAIAASVRARLGPVARLPAPDASASAPIPSAPEPDHPVANDNAPATQTLRAWLRTAFFMAILTVTLVLAWWGGRMMGYQNVIVVPAVIERGHALT